MTVTFVAKLTSKGQLTLPAALRAALDLRPGDSVGFKIDANKKVTVEPRRKRPFLERLEKLRVTVDRPITQADIDEAIAIEVYEDDLRIRRQYAE